MFRLGREIRLVEWTAEGGYIMPSSWACAPTGRRPTWYAWAGAFRGRD